MGFSRLPRFKREPANTRIHLTERDREIIRLVHRHRFLRSSHITALLGGSPQQLLRRLQWLFHHGFLTRPRAQIQYYERGGSRAMVYGLGNKGAKLLKKAGGRVAPLRWNEKNQSIGRIFLEHTLLVSDIMVALELSVRGFPKASLITEEVLLLSQAKPVRSFRWQVRLNPQVRLGIVPDRIFALETMTGNGVPLRAYFFLEADRGTMPVVRKNLVRTSMYRKFLAYQATWKRGLYQTLFGFPRFRVLIVTTSAARANSLAQACLKLKSGRGLFLFCDEDTLKRDGILAALWKSGKGETTTLLP